MTREGRGRGKSESFKVLTKYTGVENPLAISGSLDCCGLLCILVRVIR